jgi:acylphosphatase
MIVCVRCRVSGRVQGVFFRASTQRQARSLGVSGHASNMPDGSVEVVACGSESAVAQLREWLWSGPPASRVTAVDCETIVIQPPDDFSTA